MLLQVVLHRTQLHASRVGLGGALPAVADCEDVLSVPATKVPSGSHARDERWRAARECLAYRWRRHAARLSLRKRRWPEACNACHGGSGSMASASHVDSHEEACFVAGL